MTSRVTRRVALQWMGGLVAGFVLSPAPYALVDDLTVATQTRGRSTPLPCGPRGRVRTRCSACPHGCSIEVLTVGGRPYLTVPAGGLAAACALRPAVHQIALLPDRAGTAVLDGRRAWSAIAGAERAADWLEVEAARDGNVGLVDLSGRPAVATPAFALAHALPGAQWIEAMPHWLDAMGKALDLDPDLELAIDPALAERAVRVRPGRAPVEFDALRRAAAGRPGVLLDAGGSGALPGAAWTGTVARLALELDAIGPDRLFVPRRRVEGVHPVRVRTLVEVPDASLDLMVVDASRVAGAVPWRRLRAKLHPRHGRLIVFAVAPGVATRHADLVLPAPAPLEREEIVGGDRRGAVARLAASARVHADGRDTVDARDVAHVLDPSLPAAAPIDALASELARSRRGTLCDVEGGSVAVRELTASDLAARLRDGAMWEGDTATLAPGPRIVPFSRPEPSTPMRLVIEGAPVVASGERVPPVLSKVAREQYLVPVRGRACAHPDDLAGLGAVNGSNLRLHTRAGTVDVVVRADTGVTRGHVVVGCGLGPRAFGDAAGEPCPEPLEALDYDPRVDAPLPILDVEVS